MVAIADSRMTMTLEFSGGELIGLSGGRQIVESIDPHTQMRTQNDGDTGFVCSILPIELPSNYRSRWMSMRPIDRERMERIFYGGFDGRPGGLTMMEALAEARRAVSI